jgi:hypothetical protein
LTWRDNDVTVSLPGYPEEAFGNNSTGMEAKAQLIGL